MLAFCTVLIFALEMGAEKLSYASVIIMRHQEKQEVQSIRWKTALKGDRDEKEIKN